MLRDMVTLVTHFVVEAVLNRPMTDADKALVTPETLEKAFLMAESHALAPLFALVLQKNGWEAVKEEVTAAAKRRMQVVIRMTALQDAYMEMIYQRFEENGVPFIPLKGVVLRDLYPESWMRTGTDVDILVHETDLKKASALMESVGLQTDGKKTGHDVSFRNECGVHLELHYTLIEEGRAARASAVLARVWEYALPKQTGAAHHLLQDDFRYFYHIAHMAKHMEFGGCGMRQFLDLYLLDSMTDADKTARGFLLAEGGLADFAHGAQKLAAVWFAEEPPERDALTDRFEDFIVSGGSFGNLETYTTAKIGKKGRAAYTAGMFFPSYDRMKIMYPTLEKHKALLPVCYVRRFGRILLEGRGKEELAKLAGVAKADKDVTQTMSSLFEEFGLK